MNFSIVIPAYNEAETVASVVNELEQALEPVEQSFEIVVVDNGSTDDTEIVLQRLRGTSPRVKTVRVFPNKGYGNGILVGLQATSGDVVGWMHADKQVLPEDVARVYTTLKTERADLCKIVRVSRAEALWRRLQSTMYNGLFRALFGGVCQDINASPKIFRRSLYEWSRLESKDWFLDPEIMIKAIQGKYQIREVEVSWQSRKGGKSKVAWTTGWEFLKHMLWYKFHPYQHQP